MPEAPGRDYPFKVNRGFAIFWTARTLSWAGTGISGVALPVLVYDRAGSPALTSLLAAVEALPYLVLGLLAGAVADRFPRRPMMVGCDLACAALMASIPVAWALGALTTGPLRRPPSPPPVSGGPTAGLPGRSHERPRAQYPAPGSRAPTRRTCRCGVLAASR